jgi:hypothetical protein
VTCPHYLAEILVYVSFCALLSLERQQQQQHQPPHENNQRHVMVLVWVTSNLTMSALINHKWYQTHLPTTAIQGRKAIFPGIL